MSQNIYLQAARKALRFPSTKGQLSVEQLWQLSLTSLNDIGMPLVKKLKDLSEDSLIDTTPKSDSELQLQVDIIKDVIAIKKEEKAAKEAKIAKDQELQFLEGLLNEKQMDATKAMTPEQIQARIAQLKGQ